MCEVLSMSRLTMGQSMKKCREEHGMKQKELAAKAKMQASAVSTYERDVCTPTIFSLITLADVLGVSVDEYIGRTAEKEGAE